MDFSDPAQRSVFFELHSGLPREGPGDLASTRRAVELALADATRRLAVLDAGCGPGMQTLHLAGLLPAAAIVALDLHLPFLIELTRRAAHAGVASRVTAIRGDMARLPVAAASIDLVWCEGAAYQIGVANALAGWRRVLRAGGRAAFTEAVWLRDRVPDAVREFWSEYPAMGDAQTTRELIGAAGFELLGDFLLPQGAWWDDYYRPLAARLEQLVPRHRQDRTASNVLQESRREIDIFLRHGDCYGYQFFVARKL